MHVFYCGAKIFANNLQMLQCVMSIVEKAKRAVSVLQERCIRDREEMATWARRMAEETEAEVRRKAGRQYFSITS